jgi:hypothetical protein
MDGKVRPVVQQGVDLLWVQVTTSAECTKSIKILPVSGRSYEHDRKGAHRSSNQPVKTGKHSFTIKPIFEKMITKKLAFDLRLQVYGHS